jgi:uncharacterized protein
MATASVSGAPLAVVTGASSGIGFELAVIAAEHGFEVLIASDEERIESAAAALRTRGATVRSVTADLATTEGVARLVEAIGDRPVDALFANAGRGLGRGFLEQDFEQWHRVVDTNVTGTLRLIQLIARPMVQRGSGKILITGSIAGLMPGTYQAVYNGTKAFLDSFSVAFRHELKDTGVDVTCLLPGVTDTEFFKRADLMDTDVGTGKKQNAHEVAQTGFDALMDDKEKVVAGWKNKIQAFMAHIVPDSVLANMHEKMAKPGSAKH